MDEEIKEKMSILLDELLSDDIREERQSEIFVELNSISPDPEWSDYIYWSDDYLNEDNSLNYDKFFKKVFDYPNSEEYKRNERIISLTNALLKRDFSEQSEIDIVNEINELSPDINWTRYLFVDKTCLNEDGSVDRDKFLDKLFN